MVVNPKLKKNEFCPAPAGAAPSCSGYAPWILKQGGLESYGQRLISFNGETKIFFHGFMKIIRFFFIFILNIEILIQF